MGLLQSPCLQRVKRLESAGFIAGYGARVDSGRLADTIYVFTEVTISDHRREDFEIFEAGIEKYFSYIVIKSPTESREPDLGNLLPNETT